MFQTKYTLDYDNVSNEFLVEDSHDNKIIQTPMTLNSLVFYCTLTILLKGIFSLLFELELVIIINPLNSSILLM